MAKFAVNPFLTNLVAIDSKDAQRARGRLLDAQPPFVNTLVTASAHGDEIVTDGQAAVRIEKDMMDFEPQTILTAGNRAAIAISLPSSRCCNVNTPR